MKNNCSKYLGVVTSAGASDEHPMSTRSASDGRRWHSRGMQLICTLVLLFTFAIGNVWGTDPTHESPSIVEKANRTFLNLAGTPSNVTVSTDSYSNYGPGYFISNKSADLSASWWSFTGTFKSSSSSYSNVSGAVGFHAVGSSSSSEFYQILQLREGSGRMVQMDFYVTGTTQIGFQWKNANTSGSKYLEFAIYEMNVSGTTATDGASPVSTIQGSTISDADQYAASAALDGAKYYHVVVTPHNTSNLNFYGLTFKHAPAASHTVTYLPGAGSGPDYIIDDDATTVSGCPAQFSYTGHDFAGWKDALNNDVAVGAAVTSDMTLTAQWTVHVAKYTVKYMDGTTELGSEEVTVGSTPAGLASDPVKDCYTFAAWSPALSTVSGTDGQVVNVNVTWTPNYANTVDLTAGAVKDANPRPNVNTYITGFNYVSSITFDISKYEYTSNETKPGYYGYKVNTANDKLKFLVQQGKQVKVLFGSLKNVPTIKVNNVSKSLDADRTEGDMAENTFTYTASAEDALVEITFGSGTSTLKKIDIYSLYNATYTTSKSSVDPTSASNVTEVTLPTPTATTVGGYSFTGWIANQTVYKGETAKTAGEGLDAGETYTLTANTAFTAQWQLISDFNVKFYQGYGDPDAQIGETQSISTGNFAVAPADPTRTGFVFLGWSYDATEAHIVDVAAYGITAATNFTAMWKAVWTVTFDGAGNVNVENGETVASPNSPVMAGKVFQGWYNAEVKYDFSAAVTGNLALTSKWADADANHYYYNYKDDFHFDGVVYKTPEGKVAGAMGSGDVGGDTYSLTTPYTLFSGEEGITSIIATKAIYDSKNNWVNAYLKINNSAESYLTFIIKTGYTAVLKMKMGGYSADPTITLKKGEDVVVATSGEPGGKKASIENNFNEFTYELTAGTYTLTTATKTLYISHIDLEAEALPTYSVTYKAGEGTGDNVVDANTYYAGDEVTLMANPFTAPGGKIWSEWSVKDGNDDEVTVSSNKFIMPGSNVTATAVWVDDNGMARLYRSDDTEDANSPYATLAEAVAAAQDGDKIVLQRNVADGAGIMLTKDDHKTLTIDFGGYTYTAVSPGVGSAGTQNQAFHLEKGNTVTLKNGTIACSGSTIKMLIQNYCNLTLENITLDGTGLEGSHRYVMSNNCGDVVIGDGTTITAKADDVAFDVCATNYYPEGVTVTVKDGATVNGIVEYDVWGTKPANNQATLAIEGGDFDITWNVESALAEDAKENLNVSAGSFSEEVPVEYCAAGYIPAPQDPITNKYTVKEGWKVTFVDGEDEEIVAVDKNTPVAEKAMSDKIGYTFDGWFNGVDLYDFAANVTADLTLNAQWAAFAGCADLWPATSGDAPTAANQEITLQTGSNGGHIYTVSAKNDKFNESFEYTENGFALKKGGDDVIRVEMANDIVAGTKISVTLKSGDTGARGLNLLTATGAKVKGGTKLGWDDATVGAVETFSYTVEAGDGLEGTNIFRLQRNNSVYLQCVRVESCGAAIVYHNLTSAVNIAGKGTVTLGATSVREGYTTTAEYSAIDPLYEFVNWTVSGAGASVENATANPATITVGTEDAVVTLNLQLIPVKFTVNYYDGTTPMGTEQVAVNEHPTASEIDTDKRHYTFQGWAETDGGSVVALNTITSDVAATISLYAVYAPVACPTEGTVFSMEFDPEKAPTSTVKVAKNGGSLDLADYATLVGGNAVINNTETSDKDAISTGGKFLLTATKEVMKIELECAIATGDVIRIPDNNQKYVLSTSNAKTGTYQAQTSSQHEFEVTAAWNGVDDLYILYDGSSLNFTKVYVLRPYTVSFDLQGHGDAIDVQKLVEGKKVVAPTAPTADGWDFKGWYKESACTNAWDFENDVVAGTMALYAKWDVHVTNDATLKSLKYGSEAIALEDGVFEYNIGLPALTASVPALTAVANSATVHSLDIVDAAAFDVDGNATSTVTVVSEDETVTKVYTVNFSKLAALPQVNVTGSTTWNFSAGGSTSLTNQSDVVLANLPGINNDENFNSQALLGSFNKLEGTYFQGSKLSFTTEVPGKLTITFRGTNGNTRHLQACVGDGETVVADWVYNSSSTSQTKTIFVPEGKVTLKAFEGDVAQNARIYNMIFNATPDYTRPVTEGRYGTICLPNGGVMVGATLYEVAYYGQTSKKIFFDEILNGTMEAGVPYIFLPKEGASQLAVYYTDEANESAKNANGLHGFIGDDADDEMNVPVGAYILNANQYRKVVTLGTAKIKSNRSYIVLEDINPSEPALAPGRRRISMSVYSEQVATGIENTGFESEAPRKVLINGELYIIRGEKMYDAKGQLVK